MSSVTKLLPHITDAIAKTLTFADLIVCVRVNHEWHEAFSRFLYEDVVTFRSRQARPEGDWDGCEYFVDASSRLSFARYSHHIHGLTCQPRQLASILLETPAFDNLIEINYILDRTLSFTKETGFDSLTELIARSPRLQAVSIESVVFESEELLFRILDFVVILEQYPTITCVYLGGSGYAMPTLQEAIWDCLWTRLAPKMDQQINTLVLLRPDLLTRSNRGPSRGQAWTPRESPMKIQVPETNLWCDRDYSPIGGISAVGGSCNDGGRWENEVWAVPVPPTKVIAIVQAGDILHIEYPNDLHSLGRMNLMEMLGRYSRHAQGFMAGKIEEHWFWETFPSLPKLTNVDFNYVDQWMHYDRHVAAGEVRLSSYRLKGYRAYSPGLRVRLTKHFDTLVELDVDILRVAMMDVCHFLTNAPRLQSIRVPVVETTGSEPEELPKWASRHLKKISLGLYLQGHKRDLNRMSHFVRLSYENLDRMEESVEAARAIASLFMAQVNAQSSLRELELSFNHRRRLRRSPFLDLSLDPVVGLPQLSNLQKLERFVVSGLAHRMGRMRWLGSR